MRPIRAARKTAKVTGGAIIGGVVGAAAGVAFAAMGLWPIAITSWKVGASAGAALYGLQAAARTSDAFDKENL